MRMGFSDLVATVLAADAQHNTGQCHIMLLLSIRRGLRRGGPERESGYASVTWTIGLVLSKQEQQ